MSRPELRIGDRERDAAMSALGEHYAAGRITKEEYDERAAVVWAARTNAQLWPVFADLPGPHQARGMSRSVAAVPWEPAPTGREERSGGSRFPLLPVILVLVVLAVVLRAWPLLIIVGVLWWTGVFSMAGRACGRRRPHHR
jgi:Domain of unknown function (DUF1707)